MFVTFIFIEDACTQVQIKKYKKYFEDVIECEKKELPSDIDFQVGWSMKQTVTRAGDIATTLSYKKTNPVEIKSMNIKNNLNIV